MDEYLAELKEKYEDIVESSDDWAEKNMALEMLEDLRDLGRLIHD